MSSTIGVALLAVSLTGGVAEADRPVLPQSIIQAGLKKAQCSIPPKAAEIVGTELLSPRLQIVASPWLRTYVDSGEFWQSSPLTLGASRLIVPPIVVFVVVAQMNR